MHTIQTLASDTAEFARACGMRPNAVVNTVLREKNLPQELRTEILKECGRRGGKSKKRRKLSERTKRLIVADYARMQREIEMHFRAVEANEHICPVFP